MSDDARGHFRSPESHESLPSALLDAIARHGRGKEILEDPERRR